MQPRPEDQRSQRPPLLQRPLASRDDLPPAPHAFRAALKLSQLVDVILDGTHLKGNGALRGKLLDISATGCKLRFEGNVESRLQLGQVYERFKALGLVDTMVELRHLHYEERINTTFAGVRFHNLSGPAQRKVESFVPAAA